MEMLLAKMLRQCSTHTGIDHSLTLASWRPDDPVSFYLSPILSGYCHFFLFVDALFLAVCRHPTTPSMLITLVIKSRKLTITKFSMTWTEDGSIQKFNGNFIISTHWVLRFLNIHEYTFTTRFHRNHISASGYGEQNYGEWSISPKLVV